MHSFFLQLFESKIATSLNQEVPSIQFTTFNPKFFSCNDLNLKYKGLQHRQTQRFLDFNGELKIEFKFQKTRSPQ